MARFLHLTLIIIILFVGFVKSENADRTSSADKEGVSSSGSALFQRLFKLKRNEQKDAIKNIAEMKSYEKQQKLMTIVITKIMEVLSQSRVKLEKSGYLPASPFPEEDDNLRDALSSLIENSAFMGDLVLYLPDKTQEFLKNNNEWSNLFKWSLGFCQEAPFIDNVTKKMLHLVAQELNLVEREPNYVNPYARANQVVNKPSPEKVEKKKVKRKLSKGPSLSGSRSKEEL